MNFAAKSASALALALALVACGSDRQGTTAQAADTTAVTDPAATAAPTDSATATDAGSAAPEATESASATATPTPTASPSARPSAAPTTAAVTEPATFAQCKACHSVEPGKNGIGPSLAGIWGEKAGAVPGFDFSDAMKESGLTWNQANLDKFLADPRGTVPGTKMAFGGLKDAAKRQEVINYIKGL